MWSIYKEKGGGGKRYVFIISHCGEFFLIFSEGGMPFSLRMSLSNNIILNGKGCLQTETKELLSSKHYKKLQKSPGRTSAYTVFNRLMKVMRSWMRTTWKAKCLYLKGSPRGNSYQNPHFYYLFKKLALGLRTWIFSLSVSEGWGYVQCPVWQQQSLLITHLLCMDSSPCCLCQWCFWLYFTCRIGIYRVLERLSVCLTNS